MNTHNAENLSNAVDHFNFSDAALECIQESDADADADMGKIRDGSLTAQGLLVWCLEGADADREQGWRDYVAEISRVAQG